MLVLEGELIVVIPKEFQFVLLVSGLDAPEGIVEAKVRGLPGSAFWRHVARVPRSLDCTRAQDTLIAEMAAMFLWLM